MQQCPLPSNGIKLSNRVIASSEAIFVLLEIASLLAMTVTPLT